MLEALKNKLESRKNTAGDTTFAPLLVPDSVQQTRYEICLSCPHFQKLLKTCGICHCIMPLKTKLASQRCPVQKWDKYTT